MSADNFILICREGDRFAGYMAFASDELTAEQIQQNGCRQFTEATLVEAMSKAEEIGTEYGVRFAPGSLQPRR